MAKKKKDQGAEKKKKSSAKETQIDKDLEKNALIELIDLPAESSRKGTNRRRMMPAEKRTHEN